LEIVPKGILLVIGQDDDSQHFSPKPCKPSTHDKSADIIMLDVGADFRRMLILSDGMCDGGVMSFRIPK
jgi:hypothetical protein